MGLNSKLTAGLAWTGLVLVLAVPSADIVSSQLSPNSPLRMTSDMDAIQTASIGDPVEKFTSTGKTLPSYISDAPAPAVRTIPLATTTAQPVKVTLPAAPVPTTPDETKSWMPADVAVATPVAPMPYPASMRPRAPVVTDPVVVLDDAEVAALEQQPTGRRPVAPIEPRIVTEDELAGWDSGSLADYLERQGLIDGGNTSSARFEDSSAAYDEDGFFLDEGPNGRQFNSRSRRDTDDGYFMVFPDSF